jgi:hypothetical protein
MFKALYLLRTLVISMEALILLGASVALQYFGSEINTFASVLTINTELSKYLMLVPFALAAWILNELRKLPFDNAAATKILIQWPDYWKLKTHIWCSAVFAAIFVCISIAPWVMKAGISDGIGLTIFLTSVLGQLCVAGSIYIASFRIREILAAIETR